MRSFIDSTRPSLSLPLRSGQCSTLTSMLKSHAQERGGQAPPRFSPERGGEFRPLDEESLGGFGFNDH
ncbi:hypothetical protein DEO72_LG10g1885 [Vigna unguiculata]|uniref:Uncharacterized protein n=1 Tax=Vigna unguiculata TaxID=3917 RepID=A0A4D6ND26_VIGUN|nr:hypothetical protein DEO72_LG10g1885 [Vigna unguiculata]